MLTNRETATKQAVLVQLYRKQGAFSRTIKAGWRALKLGKHEQVKDALREADAIRNEARRLRVQTSFAELESWRDMPRQLAAALKQATGYNHAANSRPSGHSTERVTRSDVETIRRIDRLFAEMREQLAAGRSWVVLELISANEAILIAYAPSELVRINEAALSHLQSLERELCSQVVSFLAKGLTTAAEQLLTEEHYSGCTNLQELRDLIARHLSVSPSSELAKIGKSHPHGSPREHPRKGYSYYRVNKKTGERKLVQVRATIVNKGFKREPAETVVLSATIPTPDTLTSVRKPTGASEAKTAILAPDIVPAKAAA